MRPRHPTKLQAEDWELPALPPSLPDLAYHYMRDAILKGRLDFGEAIRQEDIGGRLGISRLPIREALRRLEADGLVVLKQRRGYFVTSLNLDEIEDIFDTAATLEERAGYFATLERTDADIADLEAMLRDFDEMIKSDQPRDSAAFGQANAMFHDRLIATSRRTHLIKLLAIIQNTVELYTRLGVGLAPALDASSEEHHAILDALIKGDAEMVATLSRIHRKNTGRRLQEYLRDGKKK